MKESFTENLSDFIPLTMIAIPQGAFMMGTNKYKQNVPLDEQPQHKVTIAPFYMSDSVITRDQYQAVMKNDPSYFEDENFPVNNVSWEDAIKFCEELTCKTGTNYRLPSESEWEYACRANSQTEYCYGDASSELVYFGNFGGYNQGMMPVKQFEPNEFGLYDMHGNAWEWCSDMWHENYDGAPTDGSSWLSVSTTNCRILRGGAWSSNASLCRSAFRKNRASNFKSISHGFRVVCD